MSIDYSGMNNLPRIKKLPVNFSYHPSFQRHWMQVSPFSVEISLTGNLPHYLKYPNELLSDLADIAEFSQSEGVQAYVQRVFKANPNSFTVVRGLCFPDGSGYSPTVDHNDHYITIVEYDPRYSKEISANHYIRLDDHLQALGEARTEIANIIRVQVERGVTEGVARAIQESTATLQQVQNEKQRIQNQIKRLEVEKARMEAIEARLAVREAEKATRKTQPRDTKGYVYLLKNLHEAGIYKIGMTTDPSTRIRKLEVVLPFPVECDCLIATSDRIALEAELHTKFADKRIDGEWFRLDAADVEYIRNLAQESQRDAH